MAGVEGEGLLNEMSLHQELNGAKRLAEFRLQKVIELQDEVVRLRRLLLTMRGGSEVLQRANSSVSRGALSVLGVVHASEGPCARNGGANRQRNGGPSSSPHPKAPAAMQVKWEQEALVKATQKNQEKLLRRPSTSLSPRPASCVRKGSRDSCVSIPRQRASSSSSLLPANCSVSSSNCLDAARRVSAVSHSGTSRPVSPFVASTASQSWATTRPLIKLHTGVQLRGPKTFRRLPPPPVESLHEDEASFISAGGPTSLLSSPQQQQQQQQQQRVCTTVVIRREHDAVREALAMLRGISLRADRNMLSTLTTLSNRRGIDRALPSALAEFKQILLRAHPSLTGRLQDGEAWRIDEDQRDALEVVQVPGMAAALRDLVITYDYTACVYQQVLYQSDGAVCAQLGKAFHEFYANMYVLLALAQCPSTLR